MVHPRRFRRLPALVLVVAGLGAGAACSGSGGGPSGQSAAKAKTRAEDAMLAFARCMRDHGVDMPDPDTSGGGPGVVTFHAGAAGDGPDPGSDTFKTANDACQKLLGDAGPQNLSPKQQQEMQDQALAFSRCMREHGVNMPDPTFDGEGHTTMKLDGDSGIDPSDPKFEAAQQACGSAFGPKGAKGGPGLAVSSGGKLSGDTPGGGKAGGIMVFGGAGAAPSGGSGK